MAGGWSLMAGGRRLGAGRWGFLLAVLLAQPASTQPREVIDRVLAIVAGDVITASDVTAARDFGFVAPPPDADATRAILTALIDRSLVLGEVERYAPPEPEPGEIDERLEAVRARFATPAAFLAALARSGLEEEHVRERLRQDLRIEAYLGQRFASAGRDALVGDWIAGLRRRADIIDLYP